MIIALTGEKLAGKGTAASYLAEHHSAAVFRFSTVLNDILERLHQPITRKNLVELAQALRSIYGNDILAQILRTDIMSSASDFKIIDGMRYMAEFDLLNDLPEFTLVYITAPVELRFERTRTRTEKSDEASMSFEEFARRESDSTEQGIVDLATVASHTITNTGSFGELYAQLDSIVQQTT